jgi:hypothetical protein
LSAEHVNIANDALYLLLSDLANQGAPLWCIQKCVEVLTTNAYIYIALKGEGFCAAGGRVFGLIVAHGGVFVVVGVLGEDGIRERSPR